VVFQIFGKENKLSQKLYQNIYIAIEDEKATPMDIETIVAPKNSSCC